MRCLERPTRCASRSIAITSRASKRTRATVCTSSASCSESFRNGVANDKYRAREPSVRVVRWLAIALALWGALLSYLLLTRRVPATWLPRPVQSAPDVHADPTRAPAPPAAGDEAAADEAALVPAQAA